MNSFPRVFADTQWTEIDGEVLILAGGRLFHLDSNGAEIWALVDGYSTVDQISEMLRTRYGDAAAADVRTLVSTLTDAGALTAEPESMCRIARYVAWTVDESRLVVLIDMRHGRRQVLSASASAVWLAIGAGTPAQKLAEQVSRHFAPVPPDLPEIIADLVQDLRVRGLLEPYAR